MENSTSINDIFRVSKGSKVRGTICSHSDMRVDGTHDGNILCEGRLIIGESAVVTGIIAAISCDIFGSVTGELYAKDTFSLKATSKFTGPVKTSKIAIEMGAEFSGTCSTVTEEEYDVVSKRISEEIVNGTEKQ